MPGPHSDNEVRNGARGRFFNVVVVNRLETDFVNELAAVFTKTDGDLRAVTRALFTSKRFYEARHYNAKDRSQKRQFNGHKDWVYSVASHAGTKRAASGSHDGEVRVWNVEDGKEAAKFLAVPGL